jgi:hypothetical protein
VAKLVARLLATAALGFEEYRHSSDIKMGDIKKGVADGLYSRPKNYTKKYLLGIVKQLTEKRSDLEFEKTGKNEVAAFEEVTKSRFMEK